MGHTMPQSQPPERYQNKFLRILLPLIASDWVSIVLEGWRFIRRLLSRLAQEGMYEILDYDSVLELQDPRGKVAVFKRRQKVKFLQDNIIAYQDYAWGDGNILADYKCSPGVSLDQYQDGFRYNILISLRETKNRGDGVSCLPSTKQWRRNPPIRVFNSLVLPISLYLLFWMIEFCDKLTANGLWCTIGAESCQCSLSQRNTEVAKSLAVWTLTRKRCRKSS
jgi:hypothetical protein